MSAGALRRRVLLTYASLALVILLGAATALLALQSSLHRSAQLHAADAELAALEEIRDASTELGRTVRRYLLVGNGNERMRTFAIASELDQLATTARPGDSLHAAVGTYTQAVTALLDLESLEPLARFPQFEQELEHARAALDDHVDTAVLDARARRLAKASVPTLAQRAQWAVVIATALGLVLAVVACGNTLRVLARQTAAARAEEAAARIPADLARSTQELRAPLETLLADIGRLRVTPRDRIEEDTLDSVTRSAARINSRLAEMLDALALTGHAGSLQREPCDVAALVDRSIRDRRDLAYERSVRLRYEAALSLRVDVDRVRMRHLLGSLLELAILETRPGGCITLRVGQETGHVRFSVISDHPDAAGEHTSDIVIQQCTRVIAAHGGQLAVHARAASRTYGFTLPTDAGARA